MSLSAYNKLLTNLAERCNVTDTKTLRKSRELINLLNTKHLTNCSDTCKMVVCLELASTLTSSNLNRDIAIKISGCNKRNYVNIFNNISKLLNLDKVYTIKEICLLVGVTQLHEVALNLFMKYQSIKNLDPALLEHPMYSCAAVLAVCQEEKHPHNLNKLVDISRIKKVDLKKLAQDFVKLYDKKLETVNSIKNSDSKEREHKSLVSVQNEDLYIREKRKVEMSDEKYNDWKRRMLED